MNKQRYAHPKNADAHITEKPCLICGNIIQKGGTHSVDFRKKKTCSQQCAIKSREITMLAKGKKYQPRPRYTMSERQKASVLKRQKEERDMGKRAEVGKRLNRFESIDESDTPKYKEQRAIDLAVDLKHNLDLQSKIYTQEEIAAIAHEITPINKIRNYTDHKTLLFAEPDPVFTRRRHESAGSLFNEGRE